jgi:hypothetical protein
MWLGQSVAGSGSIQVSIGLCQPYCPAAHRGMGCVAPTCARASRCTQACVRGCSREPRGRLAVDRPLLWAVDQAPELRACAVPSPPYQDIRRPLLCVANWDDPLVHASLPRFAIQVGAWYVVVS